MSNKLPKNSFPSNHSPSDFTCFGPAATKDGQFTGTFICDLGCFSQGEVDSNKYVHTAVVQSKITQQFFHYTEHGRVGVGKPGFQFIQCNSKAEAALEYEKYAHSKNDKRGIWVNKPGIGRVLQPKPDKDCYAVRPQATRVTGLPDAKTIVSETITVTKMTSKTEKKKVTDTVAAKLISDLNVGTTTYTKGLMADAALPTLSAIEEARSICDEATKICNNMKQGFFNYEQLYEDKELKELTALLFSRIPKKKDRKEAKEKWFLTPENIQQWLTDLDAFEASVKTVSLSVVEEENDLAFSLETLSPNHYLFDWMPKASRNVHGNLRGTLKIENAWQVRRHAAYANFKQEKIRIAANTSNYGVVPLHQRPFDGRPDIEPLDIDTYRKSNTYLLFHGTRSVNVGGILNEGFRMPKTLTNVAITGWAFGCGTYLADDYKKSVGYTSHSGSYWASGGGGINSRKAFMFVCDAIMGNPYVANRTHPYTAPPDRHHSISSAAGVFANNEYVIFDPKQINLRYLVEFSI